MWAKFERQLINSDEILLLSSNLNRKKICFTWANSFHNDPASAHLSSCGFPNLSSEDQTICHFAARLPCTCTIQMATFSSKAIDLLLKSPAVQSPCVSITELRGSFLLGRKIIGTNHLRATQRLLLNIIGVGKSLDELQRKFLEDFPRDIPHTAFKRTTTQLSLCPTSTFHRAFPYQTHTIPAPLPPASLSRWGYYFKESWT